MEAKYFSSDKLVGIGRAYAIISLMQGSDKLLVESIVIFIAEDKSSYSEVRHTAFPVINNMILGYKTIDDIYLFAIEFCNEMIQCLILDEHFSEKLESLGFTINITLKERVKLAAQLVFIDCTEELIRIVNIIKNKDLKAKLKPYYIFEKSTEMKLNERGIFLKVNSSN